MTIYIGADHRGFYLKDTLSVWLSQQGHQVVDCGNREYAPDDDFPDFAFAVADRVTAEAGSLGIVICGSGVGMAIAANKVVGIRCTVGTSSEEVRHGRENDNINMLALSADYMSKEKAMELVNVFLNTAFVPMERFTRRIRKIEERERKK